MRFLCEYTDTFGGEANYSWIKSKEFEVPNGSSQSRIMRAAKKSMELNGTPGRTMNLSEIFIFRPFRICTMMMVTPLYG